MFLLYCQRLYIYVFERLKLEREQGLELLCVFAIGFVQTRCDRLFKVGKGGVIR